MIAIVLVALLCGIAGAGLLRSSVTTALPTSFFLVVLALFGFGAVGLLAVGWVVVLVVVVLGAVAALVLRSRADGIVPTLRWALPAPVVLWLVVSGVFAAAISGMRFSQWDEFSHWGRVVAAMVTDDALPPRTSVDLLFPGYPPGLSLWEYFGAKVSGGFVESELYLAYHLLTLALFLPFAARLTWRRPLGLVFVAAGWALVVSLFFSLDAILVDPVLGLLFGYCSALALLTTTSSGPAWRHLGPALSVLVLVKDSGLLFAAIVLVLLLTRVAALDTRPPGRRRWSRTLLRPLLTGLGFVVLPVLVWRVVLATSGIAGSSDSRLAGGGLPPYWQEVTSAFGLGLSTTPITSAPFPLPFWGWFGLLALALAGVERYVRGTGPARPRDRAFVPTAVLMGGSLVYLGTLLASYVLAFTEYEALALASFTRYVSAYLLALVFVCFAGVLSGPGSLPAPEGSPTDDVPITSSVDRAVAPSVWPAALLALLLAFSQTATIASVLGRQAVANAAVLRAPTDVTAEAARAAGVGAGDKVWLLSEYSNGFQYYILGYDLLTSHVTGWSVGPPKDAADVWTQDLTVEQWADQLADVDYLVVDHTEPVVAERYGSLFDDPSELVDGAVFEVDTSSGTVRLDRVPTTAG